MPRFDLRGGIGRSPAIRVGLAGLAMIAAAEAARQLIGSGREPLEPLGVRAGDYFEQPFLDAARSYRSGQLRLELAALGVHGALLAALALGRPAFTRRALARLELRPVAGAALAGAGVAVALIAAAGPFRLAAHERAVDAGLSVQGVGGWLWDTARAAGITAAAGAAGAALLVALLRRWPRRWWLAGAPAVVVAAIALTWLAPILIGPLFNRFEPLPAGSPLRAEVLELSERAGVDVGEVYSVDASRRSTRENAYVTGLGTTKRVVLYDNLISGAEPAELRVVVAHELAHVAHADIRRGIVFVALVAPFGLLFARELGAALARRRGLAPESLPALPAHLLALALAATVLGIAGNQLSREIEASADTFALELTAEPAEMVELQQRLARANLADPDPPAPVTFLFRSHPTTLERIGIAAARAAAEHPGR